MAFFGWLLYGMFGMIISAPYCLLAGWSWEHWVIVVLVAPAYLFVWMVSGTIAGHIYPRHHGWCPVGFSHRCYKLQGRQEKFANRIFWLWTAIGLLPIVFHWSAKGIALIGHETVATMIDAHRYRSPLYLVFAVFLLLCFTNMVHSAWEATKSGWEKLTVRLRGRSTNI